MTATSPMNAPQQTDGLTHMAPSSPSPPVQATETAPADIRASTRPSNLNLGFEQLSQLNTERLRLSEALETLKQDAGSGASRSFTRLRRELDEFEPAITVLGQVKSGKTSLVNAMTGWSDMLPCDVNPWTSVVTSLHLSPQDSAMPKSTRARFQFMTEAEWDRLLTKGGRIGEMAGRAGAESELQKIRQQIDMMRERSCRRLGAAFEQLMGQAHDYDYFDKNLIENYICLGDDFEDEGGLISGRYADITRSADLHLNSAIIPHPLCLRDTPGVNDTFMMREQITIQAVRDSRICVVTLSAGQALNSVDLGLIRMISSLEARDVVIFVNRIDELSNPIEQVPEIEASIRETLASHQGPDEAVILFGSALWANAALMGRLDRLPPASSASLLNWAEACVRSGRQHMAKGPAQDMVWQLSGLPDLHAALGERISTKLGKPLLSRIAQSGLTVASGRAAAQNIRVQATGAAATGSADQLSSQDGFEDLVSARMRQLEQALDEVLEAFKTRADRAHATFIDRATHALVEHLERRGEDTVWEYDPAGLRLLLRSAHSVMSAKAKTVTQAQYEAAVREVAELLYHRFGAAVEGVQLAVPRVPDVAPPVSLGQTIALDFNDGWWARWWRRTRGYDSFADRFRKLIAGETEDFMEQLKSVQVAQMRSEFISRLQGFFDEQRDILAEISDARGGDLHATFTDEVTQERQAASRAALETLQKCAGSQ